MNVKFRAINKKTGQVEYSDQMSFERFGCLYMDIGSDDWEIGLYIGKDKNDKEIYKKVEI